MGEKLMALASAAFPDLNDTERMVVEALARGTHADLRQRRGAPDEASKAGDKACPPIRSKLLRWFCVGAESRTEIDPKGIAILGATFSGRLDLDSIAVPFPLVLRSCNIPDGIDLQDAETRRLDFSGSEVGGIYAAGIAVRGSVVFLKGFQARGAVILKGASISGDLDCTDARFLNQGQEALQADLVTIGGDVILRGRFLAMGRVNLFGATIGGTVDCEGGQFVNRRAIALYLSRARIGGNVFLRHGLKVFGEVRLHGTTITGNLECQRSRFSHQGNGAIAILADGLKVGGRVFLSESVVGAGIVSFVGGSVGSDFDCSRGRFLGSDATSSALLLDQVTIGGNLSLCNGFHAHGAVRLKGASIRGDLDCTNARFLSYGHDALQADLAKIEGDVNLGDGFLAVGRVNLFGAAVSGTVDCAGGLFRNPGAIALYLSRARVGGNVFLRYGLRAFGEVRLHGTSITGNLECQGSGIFGRESTAILADGSQIGRHVFLSEGFVGAGIVSFVGATIHGDLDCRNGSFFNAGRIALNGDQLVVEHCAWLSEGFRTDGCVRLMNARIGTLDLAGARFFGAADNGLLAGHITVTHEVIWKNVEKTLQTQLDLADASVDKLEDDSESWPEQGCLRVEGLVYKSISGPPMPRLRWFDRQPTFTPQPYEQLARLLRSTGYEADAKRIAMGKQDARRKLGGLGFWEKIGNVILMLFIGHGYAPHRALLWSFSIVLAMGLIFHEGYSRGLILPTRTNVSVTEPHQEARGLPDTYPAFNAYVYSLDTFLPIVDLREKGAWSPVDQAQCRVFGRQLNCGRILRLFNWGEILVGWVLTTLGVAGLTGLIRRD